MDIRNLKNKSSVLYPEVVKVSLEKNDERNIASGTVTKVKIKKGALMQYLVLDAMLDRLKFDDESIIRPDILDKILFRNLVFWKSLTSERRKDEKAIVRGCLSDLKKKGMLSRKYEGEYRLTIQGIEYLSSIKIMLIDALDFDFPSFNYLDDEKNLTEKINKGEFSYVDILNSFLTIKNIESLAKEAYIQIQADCL